MAPKCKPPSDRGAAPTVGIDEGDLLEITTGEGAATVTLLGGVGSNGRPVYVDARPVDDERQSWRVRVPDAGVATDKRLITVSPMRTDSGSLEFGFVAGAP